MEALGNLIRHRELLKTRNHSGVTLGVDSGSSWTKCVLMEDGQVTGFGALPTTDIVDTAARVREKVLNGSGARLDRDAVGVTGYGRSILRERFGARVAMDEITVCAKGATYLSDRQDGDATIIDIGGNDNKAITTHDGVPTSFTVGGVCAGASGRFLEVVARRLGVDISELGDLALKGEPQNVQMNAYCIVFGMQDLTAGLAAGESREDTAAAACHSVAEQFFNQQLQEIEVKSPILGIGGTSLNQGLMKALEGITGRPIIVPKYSNLAGAVGAAVLASASE
jgi:putative methanogenesis marker protein 15